MNGMDMMIKSMLGIDPTELKARLEEGFKILKATLENFDNKLSKIEAQNARIIEQLEKLNGRGKLNLSVPSINAADAADKPGQPDSAGEPTGLAAVNGDGSLADR